MKRICRLVDKNHSVIERRQVSGRPKTARSAVNIARVEELICSQEGRPGTSKSTRQIAAEIGISATSVKRIAKRDLRMTSFKRVPVQVINESTKSKRLSRCKKLLRCLTLTKVKQVFFTDEKVFYLDPPTNRQNDRVWASGRKKTIVASRLLKQRAKFSRRVMVSAGICFEGKGRLHFVDEGAKINADYYVNQLAPKLLDDAQSLVGNEFIFQQDGAPSHSSRRAQEFIQQRNPGFISKDEWPPNSPDLNPLDFCIWGAMLEQYEAVYPKPTNSVELRTVLGQIWDSLPLELCQRAVLSVRKRLKMCVSEEGDHFQHLL